MRPPRSPVAPTTINDLCMLLPFAGSGGQLWRGSAVGRPSDARICQRGSELPSQGRRRPLRIQLLPDRQRGDAGRRHGDHRSRGRRTADPRPAGRRRAIRRHGAGLALIPFMIGAIIHTTGRSHANLWRRTPENRPTSSATTEHTARPREARPWPQPSVDTAGDSQTPACHRHRPPRILSGHTGPVYAVAYAPNGKTLAAGNYDRTTRLWPLS